MQQFNDNRFIEAVNIPNPLYQSLKGRYFVGQTEIIRFGQGKNAWGKLSNPAHSDVDLFVNAFTVTNYSNQPFVAEIWFNPITPGKSMISNKVASANTALTPLPKPEVKITFAELVQGVPKKGVNVFKRIVAPKSTLVSDEDGKFIFSSGGSFVIFLVSPDDETVEAEVAFGWFEKNCK
ncbi:DUF6143 family protein [Lysinibacillus sp. KU-BSD001]|uniref:DUF6143 family protein n=1 Tax=Lysinibacillus sp. KU-BSD001 TaxID=3141328 RepID=UPI0036E72C2C